MLPQFNPRLNLKMHSDKIRIRVQRLKLSAKESIALNRQT